MRIFCSTGAFTRSSDPRSHEVILRYGRDLMVDGLEIIFYPCWYHEPERIASALVASQLSFPVLHIEKSIGDCFSSSDRSEREQGIQRFEQNCAFARQLGAELVVLHLWGMPLSDQNFEHNLQKLAPCLDLAARYELTLAVETIPCQRADPLSNVRRALEYDPRARVALDTEFLAWHKQLEAVFTASWLWQTAMVRHVHIKDYDHVHSATGERRYLHPGEGQIDFQRFVRQLKAAGFAGALSLEARAIDHEGRVDVARIQKSLQFMRHLSAL